MTDFLLGVTFVLAASFIGGIIYVVIQFIKLVA